jgi:hypothetical protein
MIERRTTPRQRVFKAGSIEFDGIGVDCVIRNLSPMGAGLGCKPVGIPHEITLRLLTQHVRQHGYVVWRKENRIGVAFDSSASDALH